MILKAQVPPASVPPPQLPMVSPAPNPPAPIAAREVAPKIPSSPPDSIFLTPDTQLPTEVVHAYQPSEELTPREEVSSSDALAYAEPERATEPPVPLPPATPVEALADVPGPEESTGEVHERFDSGAQTLLSADEVPSPKGAQNVPEIHDSERARRRERVRSKPFASFFHEFMPGTLPPDTGSISAQSTGETPSSFEDIEETRRDFRSESSVREYVPIVMDQDIEAAREKVDKTPESATAVFQLGRLLFRKGDAAAALDVLSKAVELEPNHPGAHHVAAQALVELGRYDSAAEHLRKARLLGYQIDTQLEREINQRRLST
jgi:hypothetical protein